MTADRLIVTEPEAILVVVRTLLRHLAPPPPEIVLTFSPPRPDPQDPGAAVIPLRVPLASEAAGYRCMVPVCTARRHLHHIVFRSQGGSDDPGNLVVLCQAHHLRHVHRGLVRVERQVDGQLRWEAGRPRVVFVGERRVMAS